MPRSLATPILKLRYTQRISIILGVPLDSRPRWYAMNKHSRFEYLALAALFITFFGYFAVKVWDIDFWWHVAAGRSILANGAVPSIDPFGIYDANNPWGQTVLKSQWLGQVLLYSAYRWFDLDGIILLRAAVLTFCLVIVYLRCRLAETTSLFSFAVTTLAGLAILQHTGERPQLFSFLYLSLIFLLLDSFIRSGKRWQPYCIPLLMLLWSNTHAGSVLGVAALGLFGVGLLLENWRSGVSLFVPPTQLLLLIATLGAIAMVCTPNGFATLHRIIFVENIFFVGDNPLRDRVSEYAYPWTLWPTTKYYWIFMGVTLASLPGFFDKAYWKQGLVVVVIALISITGYRYIPMFVLLAAPYVGASLNRLLSGIKLPAVAVNLSVIVITLALLAYGFTQGRVFQRGMQEGRFPTGAVTFIKAKQLGGKVFNTMNWGGYLTWQLQGAATVFIDGRMLDPDRLVPYTNILWVTPDGQRFFEQENFDFVLIPYGNTFTGERYPLVAYLQNHPDWQAAYQDTMAYLFVRRSLSVR